MEFCEGVQAAQPLALQLADEEINPRIRRAPQRYWRTWERQAIVTVQHDVVIVVLTLPTTVHLVRREQ